MVFYIFNVCSRSGHGFRRHMSWSFIYSMSVPSQDMDFNVICHGLLYIQCLFQARTWISTSYVMVFYIFNVCSKPGHGFQRHMSGSFKYSMSVLSQDMDFNVICHGLLYIQGLFQARTWFQRHMSWSFIYSMCVPSQDMDFNVICRGLLYIQCLF
jgi:hypothetical protein